MKDSVFSHAGANIESRTDAILSPGLHARGMRLSKEGSCATWYHEVDGNYIPYNPRHSAMMELAFKDERPRCIITIDEYEYEISFAEQKEIRLDRADLWRRVCRRVDH